MSPVDSMSYIENGFQLNQKTGTVFLDLTVAYNTVWSRKTVPVF